MAVAEDPRRPLLLLSLLLSSLSVYSPITFTSTRFRRPPSNSP